jgi:hypothetical protein
VAYPDAFALKNTGLSPFLCAEIGTETNGATLTLLSVLARLGKDPWAEAARWAKLPTAALMQTLVELIGRTSLRSEGSPDAQNIAARLIKLLPDRVRTNEAAPSAAPKTAVESLGRLPLLFMAIALAMGIAFNLATVPSGSSTPDTLVPMQSQPAAPAAPAPSGVTVPKTG